MNDIMNDCMRNCMNNCCMMVDEEDNGYGGAERVPGYFILPRSYTLEYVYRSLELLYNMAGVICYAVVLYTFVLP